MKRVISCLVILLLVVGLVPAQAMASGSQPSVMVVRMTEDYQDLGTAMIEQAPGSTARIIPPAGYRIVRTEVAGDTSNLVVDADGYFTMPDTTMEILVILAPTEGGNAPHQIAVNIVGNGTASAPATAASGANVAIEWEAGNGCELKSITGAGPQGAFEIDTYSGAFTMPDGDVTLTVTFGPIGDSEDSGECYITYLYCDMGGVPIGQAQYEKVTPGSSYPFSAPEGYVIDRITDMYGAPVALSGIHTVIVPEGGISVVIWLRQGGGAAPQPPAAEMYNITVTTDGNGTASAGAAQAAADETVTIVPAPAEGYRAMAATGVTDLLNPVDVVRNGGNFVFTMPARDVTVNVYFEAIPSHKVTVVKPDSVTVDIPEQVREGETVVVSPVIEGDYMLNEIIVTGPNGQVPVSGNQFVMPEGPVTVEVSVVPSVTVTFEPSGGSVEPAAIVIAKGGKLQTLPQPSRQGYLFTGWYSDAGARITTETAFETSATVTARWVKAAHTTDPASNAYGAGIAMDDPDVLSLLLDESDLASGEDVIVYLDVDQMGDSAVPSADKSSITAKVGADTLAAYLDITLWKKVGSNEPTRIANTRGGVPITMTLNAGMVPANAESVYIVYYHAGAAKTLPASYNAASRVLSFSASEFSTYALVYKPYTAPAAAASAGTLDNVPKTGDSSAILGWSLMILCGAAMLTGVAIIDRKRAR